MSVSLSHGGNMQAAARYAECRPEEITDFSVNLNPAGQPPGLFQAYFHAFDSLTSYPEPHAESLCAAACGLWNLPSGSVLFGNGATELISLIPRAFRKKRAVIPVPAYSEYENAALAAGMEICRFPLRRENGFALDSDMLNACLQTDDLVFLTCPGNPSGHLPDMEKLYALVQKRTDVFFVIDESFIDFCEPGCSLINRPLLCNELIVHSLTKFYACASLRIGYAAGTPENIAVLRECQTPWSLGSAQTECAEYLLGTDEGFAESSRKETNRLKDMMNRRLSVYPQLRVIPSDAPFFLIRNLSELPLQEILLKKYHIAVRDCADFPGLSAQWIRIAVRGEEEQNKLFSALQELFPRSQTVHSVHIASKKRKTPALMLQGTCSNAGKSILTAAFCRIFLQDGYSAAPFKSQNMALNSGVSSDGGEMGRAQILQAEACRLDPDVRMNPILLKPNSDTGSQVIVLGHAVGNMRVREFFSKKAELWKEVTAAYDSLSSEHDAVILEGAGSPGEINLKKSDIVNMRMAQYAEASVLLTGDIDRGGVYASFWGTYASFENWERNLLKGFLVNKFRGDPSLLQPAHDMIRKITGKPVVGVIDYMRDLVLPEEDSVNFSLVHSVPKKKDALRCALIQLPHISNFTDFTPFELEPDVEIRKISRREDFGNPDMVILPGSKSTVRDMEFLNRSGLAECVKNAARKGVWIIGICGGLQLMGETAEDPHHLESDVSGVSCLGLLPLRTIMERRKILAHTVIHFHGEELRGYEIHQGVTTAHDLSDSEIMLTSRGDFSGVMKEHLFASYLHGVFDSDTFRRNFLNRIRESKGMNPLNESSAVYSPEISLNRLQDHVRERVNMNHVYRWLGLK